METWLLGYRKLKNSPNRFLRQKAEFYAGQMRASYPAFLAGKLLGPNAAVRRWIGELEKGIHAELGRPTLAERLKSGLGVGAALWTGLTLKLDLFQHPKLMRTAYRMPAERWAGADLWDELRRKAAFPNLSIQVERQQAEQQVLMRLEGRLSRADSERLGQRIRDSLARSKNRLVLDLHKLQWDKVDSLEPLREKLAGYRSRVRLVLPKLAAAHPEVILLASMFQHYRG
jgi:hypothetical protein